MDYKLISNLFWSEEDLYYIIKTLFKYAIILFDCEIYHSDWKLENIAITSDDNTVFNWIT